MYLYSNGLLGHLSFLLNKKSPRTLTEAHKMAIQIEMNLSLSRTNDRTMDTLSRAFFQYRPVSDEAEDLVMKLFFVTLHGEARRWYDNLPAANITSMDHFEEIFLARWVMKLEDIQSLLRGLECIKQTEYETVRVFEFRFQRLLFQILERHHPEDKYLIYLYTNGILGNLSFLLNKKGPKTLTEAHDMAI